MSETCKYCEHAAVYCDPETMQDDEILTCYVDIVEHVKAGDHVCCDFVYSDEWPRT